MTRPPLVWPIVGLLVISGSDYSAATHWTMFIVLAMLWLIAWLHRASQ